MPLSDALPSTPTHGSGHLGELQRLEALLPEELKNWVDVTVTGAFKSELVTCVELGGDRVAIELDLPQWLQLSLDERNLLFWHQVARIQSNSLPREGWEKSALLIGLGGAIGELWVRDGVLLLLAAALAGVAGYRLYRRNRMSQNVEVAIAADLKAIELAKQYGYGSTVASHSLTGALSQLQERTHRAKARREYRTRLDALRSFPSGLP
jgi:hypothetical protein